MTLSNEGFNLLQNQWALTEVERNTHGITKYYILYWETEYFLETGSQVGTITREGIDYLVLFHKCTPAKLYEYRHMALSFRKNLDMRYGYVLVKPCAVLPKSKNGNLNT